MSFLARNEYLLGEIDYYHEQVCARLTDDRWSDNYRQIWNAVCLQLCWYEYDGAAGPGNRLVRNLLRRTRYGRQWPVDSPVLNGTIGLSRTESIACRTLFGFDVVTDGWGSWEQLATGMAEAGETLLVLRLLPYMEYMLEVGAGNGYFSFIAAQNGAAVTALEPSPLEHKQLRAGITVNGFANVAAPVCSAGESAAGGVLYLEGGQTVNTLSLAVYRATGSLVRLAAPECSLPLLKGAKDWLVAYDAPVLVVTHGRDGAGGPHADVLAAVNELARYDYSLFAVSRRPEHGAPLLMPLAGPADRAAVCFLGLPPMAHDLAEPLTKRTDMRVFTPTARLENLYYFVKNSFEEL
ncbi:MAG TPA: hypothetical protein VN521_01095 [Negativicutes bacterium]|nr:hypothetical protein [Negativicutes bacterium]